MRKNRFYVSFNRSLQIITQASNKTVYRRKLQVKKDNLPKIDRAQLKDVSEVRIDTSLPCSERMKQYVEQIGNPYCYLDHGIVVNVEFGDATVSCKNGSSHLRAVWSSLRKFLLALKHPLT